MVSDKAYYRGRFGGIIFGWIFGMISFFFRDYWKERKKRKEMERKEKEHYDEQGILKGSI